MIDTLLVDHRTPSCTQQIKTLNDELVNSIADAGVEGQTVDQDFIETVETIFRSPASLNASLLSSTHEPCTSGNSGFDVESWTNAFEKIKNCQSDTLKDAIFSGIT